ncbi:dTDP-4-dehydrorhamnose 3,5-epimerase [archaeon]|nr:dTDP-4-dehydrorhamnose 3,5-epimerase [archaeon]
MPFTFKKLEIPEVILIEPKVFKDNRGFFLESFNKSEFTKNGINKEFVQDNFSHSTKGVLRGLHFQLNPKSQGKLVRVSKGEVFDVAVDLRKDSPTYGKWVGIILSEKNMKMLYIPPNFAHGFCVLSEEADFEYKVTKEYSPELERGLIWNDPEIEINWPIKNPTINEKDSQFPLLKNLKTNFNYK